MSKRKIERLPIGTVVKVNAILTTRKKWQDKLRYDRNLVSVPLLDSQSKYAWIVGEVNKQEGNIGGYPDEGTYFESKKTVVAYRIRFHQRGKEFAALASDVKVVEESVLPFNQVDPQQEHKNSIWTDEYKKHQSEAMIGEKSNCKKCGSFMKEKLDPAGVVPAPGQRPKLLYSCSKCDNGEWHN